MPPPHSFDNFHGISAAKQAREPQTDTLYTIFGEKSMGKGAEEFKVPCLDNEDIIILQKLI